jgi:hypothetical protein
VLPLPKPQLEKFAVRICSEAVQGDPSLTLLHYPPFNNRLHEAAHSHKALGAQRNPREEEVGSGAWAARAFLEELKAERQDGHVAGSGTPGRERRESGKFGRRKSRDSVASGIGSASGEHLPELPETENGSERPRVTFRSVGDTVSTTVHLSKAGKGVLSETESLAAKQIALGLSAPQTSDGPPSPGSVATLVTSDQSSDDGVEEEDTSITGARKDQLVFGRKKKLFKPRRSTLMEAPEDPDRIQRLEERFRKVMRFIPGLENETLGLRAVGTGEGPVPGAEGGTKSVRWTERKSAVEGAF